MAQKSDYTIMIVDDEPDICEMLADEFEMSGFKILTANGGNEAFDKLKENKGVNVIISDVRMPNGDGASLLDSVNTLPKEDRPIFFFITGQADITKSQAIEKGAKDFFSKPFNLMELVEEVEKCLDID